MALDENSGDDQPGVLTNAAGAPNESSKFRKNKKRLFLKGNTMVSTEEMIKAVQEFSKHLPPISEEDIELVKCNPSISFISKIKLIRKMRKAMK